MNQQKIKQVIISIFDEEQKKQELKFELVNGNYEFEELILKPSENEYGDLIFKRIDPAGRYKANTNELERVFQEEYNKRIQKLKSDNDSGVEGTEDAEPNITVPYNPSSIKIQQARFTLKQIFEMIKGEEDFEPMLDLSPDFQRNYVWDRTRKSRLIESILLQIPLPVIYLARDYEGKYQVVDGVQRLSVIEEYFSNGFRLVNLEYLNSECEGKYYNKNKSESLHVKFVRQLRTYQIDCYVIEPSTPADVKFDIFKRLNTGGKALNNQEIRNSIMRTEVRNFIRKLAEKEEFKKATNYTIKPKRMMDQEFVLRYIAFYMLYKKNYLNIDYTSNMHNFLNLVVDEMNQNHNSMPFNEIELNFEKTMNNAINLFGEYAFKKMEVEEVQKSERNRLINKALFTSFSVLLSSYSCENIACDLSLAFAKYLEENEYLYECITYGTSDKVRIDTTFLLIDEFLKQKVGEHYDQ